MGAVLQRTMMLHDRRGCDWSGMQMTSGMAERNTTTQRFISD